MEYKPMTAVWEITFACNMRCKHCGSSCEGFLPDELTTKEALRLCDDIGRLGLKYLTLSGGEPFMRKDWYLIARRLRENNVIPVIISNGWYIDENIVDKTLWAAVSNIAVSLDGLKKSHDFMRIKGSFDRTMNALALLKKKGVSSSVVTCINKDNIKQLPRIKALLVENGVESWQVQIGVAMGNLLSNAHLIIDPEQVDTIIDFAHATNNEGKILVYPADCVGYYNMKEIEIRQMLAGNKYYDGVWRGCPAGKHSFGIRCNGDIIGCTSIRDDAYIEGNVRETSLPDIWNNKDAFAWNRKMHKSELTGFCGNCQYGAYCLGGCSNVKLTMSQSLYENRFCSFRVAVEKEMQKAAAMPRFDELVDAGKTHCDSGDYQFAEAYFTKALQFDPKNNLVLDYLGFVHFQMENYETSLRYNKESISLNPENAYALKGMGNCLVKLGKRDDAVTFLKKSIQKATGDFTDPYYDLAVVHYDAKQYREAKKILDEGEKKSRAFGRQSNELCRLIDDRLCGQEKPLEMGFQENTNR